MCVSAVADQHESEITSRTSGIFLGSDYFPHGFCERQQCVSCGISYIFKVL